MFGVITGMLMMQKDVLKRRGGGGGSFLFYVGHLSWNSDQNRLQNVQANELTLQTMQIFKKSNWCRYLLESECYETSHLKLHERLSAASHGGEQLNLSWCHTSRALSVITRERTAAIEDWILSN